MIQHSTSSHLYHHLFWLVLGKGLKYNKRMVSWVKWILTARVSRKIRVVDVENKICCSWKKYLVEDVVIVEGICGFVVSCLLPETTALSVDQRNIIVYLLIS